jgi:hypothetical protein
MHTDHFTDPAINHPRITMTRSKTLMQGDDCVVLPGKDGSPVL